jgi:integrase
MALKIKNKKGVPTWHFAIYVKGERYTGFLKPAAHMTKYQAENDVAVTRGDIIAGKYKRPRQKKVALLDSPDRIFQSYLSYLKDKHPSTYKTAIYTKKHFEYFHHLKPITPEHVQHYQRWRLGERVKGSTINREIQYYRAAYNRAGVSPNPFMKFEKFDESRYERTRFLNAGEMRALLEACKQSNNKHLLFIVLIGIATGLRKQAILKLKRRDIDYNLKCLVICKKGDNGKKDNLIPLPAEVLGVLKPFVDSSAIGYLFENPKTGLPYTDIKKGWRKALDRAKVGDFVFHDLRHTYATYALLMSKNVRLVQSLLGHSSIKTTQKYTHVLNSMKTDLSLHMGKFITGLTLLKTPPKK